MELLGKNIRMRLAEITDAEFILSLRLDENKTKYLSKVNDDLTAQRKWLELYKIREKSKNEYYFIICDNASTPCGTVRLYDFTVDSFSWGSWLINTRTAPITAGIESALLVYEFGYYKLNFEKCHFEVVTANSKVRAFHEKMGAWIVSSDSDKTYYNYNKESYDQVKKRYKKFI